MTHGAQRQTSLSLSLSLVFTLVPGRSRPFAVCISAHAGVCFYLYASARRGCPPCLRARIYKYRAYVTRVTMRAAFWESEIRTLSARTRSPAYLYTRDDKSREEFIKEMWCVGRKTVWYGVYIFVRLNIICMPSRSFFLALKFICRMF